jgi:signal transduction histidine kinase/CHASE3 domain sensor protein/CheY-like chemotaxis protein
MKNILEDVTVGSSPPDHRPPAPWLAYTTAVGLTGATLLLRLALTGSVGDRPVLILFAVPIIISAYIGGPGPGLLATILVALSTDYFLLPPKHSFLFQQPEDLVHWLILVFTGLLMSVLSQPSLRPHLRIERASNDGALVSTERKVRLGFGFALACLGVVGMFSYWTVARLKVNAASVEHTHEVINRIELLIAAVMDSETAERGYVITGDNGYLEPHRQSAGVAEAHEQRLRELTADNPAQQERLAVMTSLIAARLANLREVIELRRASGFEAAQQEILLGKGKRFHDQIRALIYEMKRTEIALLATRERLAARSAGIAQAVIMGGGFLAFGLVGLSLFAIRRDFAGRARAEQALRKVKDELEMRVQERTAELGHIARNLELEVAERTGAQQKLQSQLERMNLLQHITRAIGERQDIRSIFQVVIRTLEEQLPVDFCCVCLYDPAARQLTVTSVGARSSTLAMELAMTEQARIEIDENGLSRCVRGELVCEHDVAQVPFPFPQRLAQGGLRSMTAAPLLLESKVFGILIVARRRPESFSSGECEFMRQLSEHVALAAHQAELYGALQQAYDDLRQTQRAVMQQERLLALGQMASGIAHDINNAISPVALYTESLLESETGLSPRARSQLETIQRAIEDVAQTVARMREFYRKRESQVMQRPVDLNRLVPQVMDLTRARWSDMAQQRGVVIDVRCELAPNLPAILGSESELREAMVNLVFNAVDAMPSGGPLILRTQVVPDNLAATPEQAGRPVVQLEVADAGVGMDEETRRRCLEPFFTTKGERGTGLGLAMVYGAMQRHGADIEIDSAPGNGTTIRCTFEIPSAPATDATSPVFASLVIPPLRILIVDDDPLVIRSLRDTLEADGHTVTSADGGQAGIDAFRAALAQGHAFPIVITDLGMPYVDGRQVATRVKEAASGTAVILLTGWGQRLVAAGEIPANVDRVLNKPPRLRELREALATALATRAP